MAGKRSATVIQEEIATLERLRAKRKGKAGFTANVEEIEARLEAAKAELGDG